MSERKRKQRRRIPAGTENRKRERETPNHNDFPPKSNLAAPTHALKEERWRKYGSPCTRKDDKLSRTIYQTEI